MWEEPGWGRIPVRTRRQNETKVEQESWDRMKGGGDTLNSYSVAFFRKVNFAL